MGNIENFLYKICNSSTSKYVQTKSNIERQGNIDNKKRRKKNASKVSS